MKRGCLAIPQVGIEWTLLFFEIERIRVGKQYTLHRMEREWNGLLFSHTGSWVLSLLLN